ncbi:hypothetical protein Bca52824_039355 [Brassica carinata]|uniref:Uncharacterized protein n=1 Tax=Brassica carinata TaxID=52824 RepID=A0A8X7UY23_BRACI|nr:hypothetical protein Bca52824_039355 [Brassica carinata]
MELQVITVIDVVEVEMNNEDWIDTFEDENRVVTELMELSFSSYLALSSPTTIKIWGKIEKTWVMVLLYSGATHNFLDPYVAIKLNLAPQQGANLDIILGIGIAVRSAGVCHQVPFTLQQNWGRLIWFWAYNGFVLLASVQWTGRLMKCLSRSKASE